MVLVHQANLTILARVATRLRDGQLDVEIVFGKIKIRCEKLENATGLVPSDGKTTGLVLPVDSVEVEHACKLGLTCVCERNPGHSHGLLPTLNACNYPAGRRMIKRAPPSGERAMETSPPARCAIARTIARPMPLPSDCVLPRTPVSKSALQATGATPAPSSSTVTLTVPSS